MSWLVIACGVLLAAAGGYSIVSGAPYTQMEFGWTEVIAGTTALAGGLVTIALGAILYRLGALQKVVARAVIRTAAQIPEAQIQEAQRPEASVAVAPPPLVPAPDRSEADMARVAPPPPDLDPQSPSAIDMPPPRSLVSGLRSRFRSARTTPVVAPAPLAEPHLTMRPALTAVSSPDAMPDAAPPVAGPAEMETASRLEPASAGSHSRGVEDTDGRDVVGRYEAGGASYMLFSDGTIEVETATGMHRFASMEELKAFVERQDAEKASLDL